MLAACYIRTMKSFFALLARLFRRKTTDWDSLNYGKPSAEQDEFRDKNNV